MRLEVLQMDCFSLVTQNYTFNIMLFSNLTDGETISFKYYHAASGEVFCLSETVDFESDMIIANAIAPFTFNLDVEFVLGCNDQSACNYDPTSNFNDGSCEYPEEFYDCDGNCLSDSDTDGICDEEEILGCTNEDALNFNQEATEDDGSCILGCTDELVIVITMKVQQMIMALVNMQKNFMIVMVIVLLILIV